MARIPDAVFLLLFVVLAPALVTGQEVQDTWLDGETLMLEMVSPRGTGESRPGAIPPGL